MNEHTAGRCEVSKQNVGDIAFTDMLVGAGRLRAQDGYKQQPLPGSLRSGLPILLRPAGWNLGRSAQLWDQCPLCAGPALVQPASAVPTCNPVPAPIAPTKPTFLELQGCSAQSGDCLQVHPLPAVRGPHLHHPLGGEIPLVITHMAPA